MPHVKTQRCLAAAALVAAALAGCHDDNQGSTTPVTSTPQSIDFVVYASQVYENDPNSTPKNLDGLTFDFSNEDPTAFDGLLM